MTLLTVPFCEQKASNKSKGVSARSSGPVQFVRAEVEVFGPQRPPTTEDIVGPPRPQTGLDDDVAVGPPRPAAAEEDEDIVGPPRPPTTVDDEDMVGPPRPGESSTEDDDDNDGDAEDEDEDEFRVPLSNEIVLKGHTKVCHPCMLVFRN